MAKKISTAFGIITIAAFAIFVGSMSWIWCNYENLEVYNSMNQDRRRSCAREGDLISAKLLPNGAKNKTCCQGLAAIPMDINSTDVTVCTKCGDGICKKPENEENCPADCNGNIVGNDQDEHGCIGSAGYQWCEKKQKCLRNWEEECKLN